MASNMRKKEYYLLSMMKKRRAGLLTIKQGILICKVIESSARSKLKENEKRRNRKK